MNCEGEGASVAQVWIRSNDCQVVGGDYYGAVPNPGPAFVIGDPAGSPVAGYEIDAQTSGLPPLDFANGAGLSRVCVRTYASMASQLAIQGTPSATTHLDLQLTSPTSYDRVLRTTGRVGIGTPTVPAASPYLLTVGTSSNGKAIAQWYSLFSGDERGGSELSSDAEDAVLRELCEAPVERAADGALAAGTAPAITRGPDGAVALEQYVLALHAALRAQQRTIAEQGRRIDELERGD